MSRVIDAALAAQVRERIVEIASNIGSHPPGLVHHRPESWAVPARCFENASAKVKKDGGGIAYGWTIHFKFVDAMPDQVYLYLTHHAVWRAPDGSLVDVTPYPDPKHCPLPGSGPDIWFLVDSAAEPIHTSTHMGPLPLRYFAIGDDKALLAYVQELSNNEQKNWRKLYEASGSA